MRIRTVKPEFFEDKNLAKLSPYPRLLVISCWMLADKNGVLENRPAWIQSKVFPYEHGDESDVSRLLPVLVSGAYLVSYEVDGRKYLRVRNFSKHQRITGKEAQGEGRHPLPHKDLGKEVGPGNNRESPGKHPDAQEQGTGNREQGTGDGVGNRNPAAAMNASLDGFENSPSAPPPAKVIRELRTFGDLQAMNPKIHVGKGEREAWDAVLRIYGWDITQEAITEQAKTIKQPGHRVLLSMVQRYLDANYERAEA